MGERHAGWLVTEGTWGPVGSGMSSIAAVGSPNVVVVTPGLDPNGNFSFVPKIIKMTKTQNQNDQNDLILFILKGY